MNDLLRVVDIILRKMKRRIKQFLQLLLGLVTFALMTPIALGRLCWGKIVKLWRKVARPLQIALAALVAVLTIFIAAMAVYALYDVNFGRDRCKDYSIAPQLVVHTFNDGKCRIFNSQLDKYVTPRLDDISTIEEGDSVARFAIKRKSGYLNAYTGEIIVPTATYDCCFRFSEGLAAVMECGKIGFIDRTFNYVIEPKFDCRFYAFDCEYNQYPHFMGGLCVMGDGATKKFGIINTQGEWVVEPKYDNIDMPDINQMRVIYKDDAVGVVNSRGEIIYQADYESIDILDNHAGFVLTRAGRMWHESLSGQVLEPFIFDSYRGLGYNEYDEKSGQENYRVSRYSTYIIGECVGLMDATTYRPITTAVYGNIEQISATQFLIYDNILGCHYQKSIFDLRVGDTAY